MHKSKSYVPTVKHNVLKLFGIRQSKLQNVTQDKVKDVTNILVDQQNLFSHCKHSYSYQQMDFTQGLDKVKVN